MAYGRAKLPGIGVGLLLKVVYKDKDDIYWIDDVHYSLV